MSEGKQAINQIDMRAEEQEVEIDLLDLFSYYRRRIVLIIGAFIIGALIAGLITQFVITPKYTATAKMYMVSSSSGSTVDLSDFNIGQSLSSDYVELVKTRPIITQVIKELNLDYTYEEMLTMLSISVVTDTRILTMSVTSDDREEARDIANLLAEKAEIELPKLMDTREPHIAERAILPTHKSSPSLSRNVLLGALLAMLLVLAILTVMYLMDDTIKTAEDVEKYFGALPLTVIPEGKIEGLSKEEQAFKRKRGKKRKGSSSSRQDKSSKKEPSYYYVSEPVSSKPSPEALEKIAKTETAPIEEPVAEPAAEEMPEAELVAIEEPVEEPAVIEDQVAEPAAIEEQVAELAAEEMPEEEPVKEPEDEPEEIPAFLEQPEEEPIEETVEESAEEESVEETVEELVEETAEESVEVLEEASATEEQEPAEESETEEQPDEEPEAEEEPAKEFDEEPKDEPAAIDDIYIPKAEMIVFCGDPQSLASAIVKEQIEREENGQSIRILTYRDNGDAEADQEYLDMLRQADEENADAILTAAIAHDHEQSRILSRLQESGRVTMRYFE